MANRWRNNGNSDRLYFGGLPNHSADGNCRKMLVPWKKSYGKPNVVLVIQSCPTFCDPMDYSPPGSSVHGIPQARILVWVAISFSRDLPNPGMANLESVLKSRDITLPTKVHLVKAMVFPVVMYRCES